MTAAAPRALVGVSVARAVAAFMLTGLVVLTVIGVLLAVAQKRQATGEAIRDARSLTHLQAEDVVAPRLTAAALVPGSPAFARLDREIRERVLGSLIVGVKIWDETGLIVYSDDASLVGRRFALPARELAVLRTGDTVAEVGDVDEAEKVAEPEDDRLLQVYLRVTTADTDQRLLLETYQPYDTIQRTSAWMYADKLPVLVGGLVLLYAVQAPLAYRMARRLRAAQDEREQLLVASLAVADRERSQIASDLHDGVVQGLAGASWTLSAAASCSSDTASAEQMGRTAMDLRRWVRELRSLIVTVAPPALRQQGLAESLHDLVAPLEVRGIDARIDVEGVEELPEVVEALAHRVAQEAVRNVVRHASASGVWVQVRVEQDVLVLRVRDDGVGFDPAEPTRRRGSVGLELLSSLVAAQEGTLEVESAPGAGTEIALRVPVPVPVLAR